MSEQNQVDREFWAIVQGETVANMNAKITRPPLWPYDQRIWSEYRLLELEDGAEETIALSVIETLRANGPMRPRQLIETICHTLGIPRLYSDAVLMVLHHLDGELIEIDLAAKPSVIRILPS